MNHKLGNQWVEVIDDKLHMLKAVEGENCTGCAFGKMFQGSGLTNIHVCDREDDCPLEYSDTVVKDLGILNEDGCLPEERTGKYPTIKDRNEYEGWLLLHIWDCIVCEKIGNDDEAIEIRVSALTRQEVIERWNRRA